MCMGKLYDCNCWAQPGGANDDTCDADRVCSGSVTDGIAEVTASPEMECTLGALKDFNEAKVEAFLEYMNICVAQFNDVYNTSTVVAVATPTKVETVSEKEANYKSDCDSYVAWKAAKPIWARAAYTVGQHEKGCEIGERLRANGGATVDKCEAECGALYGGIGCCQCNPQVCDFMHIHVYSGAYIHTCARAHTHTHTYTHTQFLSLPVATFILRTF